MGNTIDISLILYAFLIGISLTCFMVLWKIIKNGSLEDHKIDKLTDLFKTVILGTVVTTIGIVISDIFKEREYDKNEMTAFNTYLPYVMDTTSIESKLEFCSFFEAVSPEGNMKQAWKNWGAVLEKKRIKVKSLEEKSKSIINDSALPSNIEISQYNKLLLEKNNILSSVNATDYSSYIVLIGADKDYDKAKYELKLAKTISPDAVIFKRKNWFRTAIPVQGGFEEAKKVLAKVNENLLDRKTSPYIVRKESYCNLSKKTGDKDLIICDI